MTNLQKEIRAILDMDPTAKASEILATLNVQVSLYTVAQVAQARNAK